jgi:type IV secretion system protein VirB4
MTRANANQWFTAAKAANSIVPIARFVSPTIFATKTSGYGCLFSVAGVDEEGLTDQELDARVRAVEGGLRGLPEGACLYQYMRIKSGFDIPRRPQYDERLHRGGGASAGK